ncbi:iron-containing alcohol dehydrogenase [Methylobacterium sp. Leaf466]|uniref:iron-containing alcohol dehydrogenase n=1 Tax=Methylobacterium sp. Leaf466 TaxID=1736386 RepID=UPI0006F6E0CE|nr:iron-containing alcohol dehydrogenase [Methylobacterium sp. Leaf466]KQT87234.1 alcohol dehydrogenase [Methylobacterium sp. Leaf466]
MAGAAIALPRVLRIGAGTLGDVGDVLRDLGVSRPFVVTDRFLAGQPAANRLTAALAGAGMTATVFADAIPDPTEASVALALAAMGDGQHDCVIGFGGGSPIDTAKAVAVLAARGGGRMRALKAPHVEDRAGLPVIAIPTTAGTGSEATRFTIVTDEATDEKMLCIGQAYLPVAAIVDYELTLSKPARLTADTGIDALTHAIEGYVSRRANPFSDGIALLAMKAIAPNLRTVFREPGDRPAREAMMLGALQAGMAFSNASVALVHGMSRPIGAHFHVAHGLSNAMLLPVVTAFSASAAPARYADCARAMGLASEATDDAEAVARLVSELRQLNRDLEVPSPRAYGLDEGRWRALIPVMAEQALASGSPANNPRIPSAAEIATLYEQAWEA